MPRPVQITITKACDLHAGREMSPRNLQWRADQETEGAWRRGAGLHLRTVQARGAPQEQAGDGALGSGPADLFLAQGAWQLCITPLYATMSIPGWPPSLPQLLQAASHSVVVSQLILSSHAGDGLSTLSITTQLSGNVCSWASQLPYCKLACWSSC